MTIEETPELPELIRQLNELMEGQVVGLIIKTASEIHIELPAANPDVAPLVLDVLADVDWVQMRRKLVGDVPT